MFNQVEGIQLKPTIGTDFNTQYGDPGVSESMKSTLPNGIYNLNSVNFEGKQTDNIAHQTPKAADIDTRGNTVGLKPNFEKKGGLFHFLSVFFKGKTGWSA